MYELIRPVVKDKTVLEVATGTGLIAKHIVKAAAHIEATDASPEMCIRDRNPAACDLQIFTLLFQCMIYLVPIRNTDPGVIPQ